MNVLKKAAISVAATAMMVTPMAASAAPSSGGARAVSVTESENQLEGGSWVAIVLGLAIIGGGIWLLVDDDGDDEPVSP